MYTGYKYRIYPTKEQIEFFNKNFDASRFIYNTMLYDKIEYYKETKTMLKNTPAQYKEQFPFLKEVDSHSLCSSHMNLDKAFKNFFKNPKKFGFPNYKKKKDNRKSYTTNNIINKIYGNNIRITNNKIRLPKLNGMLKIKKHIDFDGVIKSCTISHTPSGRYYISILVDENEQEKSPQLNNAVGIDLGIKTFAVLSNGQTYDNPKFLTKSAKRLAKLQKDLARKINGSSNYEKNRIKAAKVYEKITNQQNDFLHKITSKIISENQTIVIEGIGTANLMKNNCLSKSIAEVSWGKFNTMLSYKAERYGRNLIIADRMYPSSQLCSTCGYKNPLVKNLKVREWECPSCGVVHDRDFNASLNLLSLAYVNTN